MTSGSGEAVLIPELPCAGCCAEDYGRVLHYDHISGDTGAGPDSIAVPVGWYLYVLEVYMISLSTPFDSDTDLNLGTPGDDFHNVGLLRTDALGQTIHWLSPLLGGTQSVQSGDQSYGPWDDSGPLIDGYLQIGVFRRNPADATQYRGYFGPNVSSSWADPAQGMHLTSHRFLNSATAWARVVASPLAPADYAAGLEASCGGTEQLIRCGQDVTNGTILGDIVMTAGVPSPPDNFNGWSRTALHPTPGRYLTAEVIESSDVRAKVDSAGLGIPPSSAYTPAWCCQIGPTDGGTLLYWRFDEAPPAGTEVCLLSWQDVFEGPQVWHAWPANGTLVSNHGFGSGRDAAWGLVAGGHGDPPWSFTIRVREYDLGTGPAGVPASECGGPCDPETTQSGRYPPNFSGTTDSTGRLFYTRAGITNPPWVITPGFGGAWNFPAYNVGGVDFMGDSVGNVVTVLVVGPGTIALHTAQYTQPRTFGARVTHLDGGVEITDASVSLQPAGSDIVLVVPDDGFCYHHVYLAQDGSGAGDKLGFAGYTWDSLRPAAAGAHFWSGSFTPPGATDTVDTAAGPMVLPAGTYHFEVTAQNLGPHPEGGTAEVWVTPQSNSPGGPGSTTSIDLIHEDTFGLPNPTVVSGTFVIPGAGGFPTDVPYIVAGRPESFWTGWTYSWWIDPEGWDAGGDSGDCGPDPRWVEGSGHIG